MYQNTPTKTNIKTQTAVIGLLVIANSKQVNVINSYEKELTKIQKSGRNNKGPIIPYPGKELTFNPERDLKELSLKSLHAMKEIHNKMMDLEDELAI